MRSVTESVYEGCLPDSQKKQTFLVGAADLVEDASLVGAEAVSLFDVNLTVAMREIIQDLWVKYQALGERGGFKVPDFSWKRKQYSFLAKEACAIFPRLPTSALWVRTAA